MSKEKLSISKKTILIASALVLAIGIPIAYFLITNTSEDSGAWYSSSWLYRRSISVANSGGTLTNEDVLIEYDTASLVTAGKLQSDCDDLRFVDSDDSTALAYWVEGGCNTSTTHIWVRIPSLPSGGKTIYMYYGNSSATNAEETWTGKFYLMKDASCDSGWTTESNSGGDFFEKFPYPASTYGTTEGSISHAHNNIPLTTSEYLSSSGTNTNTNTGNTIATTHSHDVTLTVQTNSSVLPPYLDMIFCSNNDLIVKQNGVAVFTSAVPSGFTQFSALNGLFPRGNSSYGGTSTTTTHTHTTSQATTGGPSGTTTCASGAQQNASSTHTHDFSSDVTASASQIPVYMQVIYGEAASSDVMAPFGMITMSNATPPLGWTRYSSLDGSFPYGSTSYGGTGGTSTHNHSVSLTSGNFSGSVGCSTGNPKVKRPLAHTHTATGTTSDYSNTPPNISTLFIQKKTSQSVTINNEEVPNQAPNAPTNLLAEQATNPTGVTDLEPEFSAVYSDPDSDDGTYYEIEVNTQSDFLGTYMWDTGQLSTGPITSGNRSSDFIYTGSTLSLNSTTYYWRIRFWDDNGAVSNWSSTANFTMASANNNPNAPSSLLTETATNPTKVIDDTPEFSSVFTDTDTGDTGTYYQIEVNTQSDFLGTSMWDSIKTATGPITNGNRSTDIPYNGTTLTENGLTYYWRMKFWDNNGGESAWSSTAQFTMSGQPSAPSSLQTEGATNPTNVLDLTPEFSAIHLDPNGDSTAYYEIEVNTLSNFTGTVMWDSGQQSITIAHNARSSEISYGNSNLTLNGNTYYWRIRFWDTDSKVSSWSSTAQFTMYSNTAPNAPSSIYAESSTNPTKVTDDTPEFSAVFTDTNGSDTGVYYQIQVNTQSDFLGTSMWDSNQQAITPITNGARSTDIIYNGTTLTLNGVTYYWRIKFWDNYGAESSWSSTAQFTMSGVPYAPTSLQAEGGTNPTGVTDLTPEFSAIHTDPNGDSTTHYEIEVNTLSNFTGTVMWDSGQQAITVAHNARSAEISYGDTDLSLNGATYYWRIRFWDSLGVSDWSSTANFTMYSNTAPNAPSSLQTESSTNPTKVTDTTPEFSAIHTDAESNSTASYQIEVNTQSDFMGTSMWDSGKQSITVAHNARSSDISYAGTTLTENGITYYWRIKFWDIYDAASNWSSTAQFTMSGVPYAPTSLLTEAATNPTGVTDLTPEFSAIHTDPNADSTTHYEIEVNTQSDFLGTVMWDSGAQAITVTNNTRSSEISYGNSNLTLNSTTYYWRIRFYDSVSTPGAWSSTAQFTMAAPGNSAPNAPSSLQTESSTNPIKVTDDTPEFSAVFSDVDSGDTGIYYEIEVNTNNSFTGTVMWDSTQTSITPITNGARSIDISYAGTALSLNGTTYYWRMKFWDNSSAESVWSSTAQFTMSGVPYPPTSLETEGGTNPTGVTDTTPEFTAIHTDPNTDSATHYQIQVNTQSDFLGTTMWDSTTTSLSVTNNTRSSQISYGETNLSLNGSTYYWRIRFYDSISTPGAWSATSNFTMHLNITPNAPSTPYVEASTNPTKVTDNTPEFSAVFTDTNGSDTGISYEIEVNTNNSFTGTVMWDSNKTSITPITNGNRSIDISYGAVTPLALDGTTYYWRIRFWDTYDAVSNWSSTAEFTMSGPPYAPTSLLTEGATNPTSVADISPEFSAIHTDPNADSTTHYEIEVNTQSDFLGTVMWDSGAQTITVTNNTRSSDISYGNSNITLNGTTYYWRIRFYDSISTPGAWSSTAQFTMATNVVPNAPSSLYTEVSANPTKVIDTTPEFSAVFTDINPSDTGTSYQIQVNTQSDFLGTTMWDSTKTATGPITNGNRSSEISYGIVGTPVTLTLNGATYYWRMKFWDNSGGESSWSSTAQFQMSGAPLAPSQGTVDGMTNPTQLFSITPEFTALHSDPNGDNAVYYEIDVNSASDFTGTIMWNTGKTSMTGTASGQYIPDVTYAGTALTGTSNTVYYWRIRLWDADDIVSEWSTTASFTDFVQEEEYIQMEGVLLERVKINPSNQPPSAPADFYIGKCAYSATFNDSDINDTGNYYEVEVNTQSDFNGTVVWDSGQTAITPITNGSSTGAIAKYFSDNPDTTYYARMRFWDNSGALGSWAQRSYSYPSGLPPCSGGQ